jgi:hypothetical protein
MSGVFKSPNQSPAPAPKAEAAPAEKAADTGSTEDRAARRRARRGGRALLSESRINPEEGVSTLGTTGI